MIAGAKEKEVSVPRINFCHKSSEIVFLKRLLKKGPHLKIIKLASVGVIKIWQVNAKVCEGGRNQGKWLRIGTDS